MTRRARSGAAGLVVVLALSGAVGACSGSDPTPAEARRDRVQARLRTSFSATQARCIIARADDSVLRALDRSADLSPTSKSMAEYSDLIVACVTDPDGTTTTSSTTTAAPASSTTSTTEP